MAEDAADTVQIVLGSVPDQVQPAAALFLSGCFSLPPASTRAIASSGPIALLAGLDPGQADAILAELAPSLPQNVELSVRPGGEATVSRLQWPRPPRIYGKDIEDFLPREEEARDVKCPICGGALRLAPDGALVKAPFTGHTERRPGDAAARRAAAAGDSDPLFSGVKPLGPANTRYASLQSLQAGDTGFWMTNREGIRREAAAFPPAASAQPPAAAGESSHTRRARPAAGLAAFMKPGVFAVVLGRTRDAQIVHMIAEIMGIPEPEARDRCLNLSLTVAREIALDEAQNLLARLRNLGAKARIVKPEFF